MFDFISTAKRRWLPGWKRAYTLVGFSVSKSETLSGVPVRCQLNKHDVFRSALGLGSDFGFEARWRECFNEQNCKSACEVLVQDLRDFVLVVSLGGSAPQTNPSAFGVGVHSFSSPGNFGLCTFPNLPTPCRNEVSGRKGGGAWYESPLLKP